METRTYKKWPSKTKKHFRDFIGMALQIMAFNLATDGREHSSSSVLNSIGFVLLRILMEHKYGRKAKELKALKFLNNTRNIFHKQKPQPDGNRQPKV